MKKKKKNEQIENLANLEKLETYHANKLYQKTQIKLELNKKLQTYASEKSFNGFPNSLKKKKTYLTFDEKIQKNILKNKNKFIEISS